MRATRDQDLTRQGLLLLAFDLLVVALVLRLVAELTPSPLPTVTAIVLAAGGVLAVMAALVVGRSGGPELSSSP